MLYKICLLKINAHDFINIPPTSFFMHHHVYAMYAEALPQRHSHPKSQYTDMYRELRFTLGGIATCMFSLICIQSKSLWHVCVRFCVHTWLLCCKECKLGFALDASSNGFQAHSACMAQAFETPCSHQIWHGSSHCKQTQALANTSCDMAPQPLCMAWTFPHASWGFLKPSACMSQALHGHTSQVQACHFRVGNGGLWI